LIPVRLSLARADKRESLQPTAADVKTRRDRVN
jgi:hypothetical protein